MLDAVTMLCADVIYGFVGVNDRSSVSLKTDEVLLMPEANK